MAVDSRKLEHGPGRMYGGVPSFLGFGVGGQSYLNFLVSTVNIRSNKPWFLESPSSWALEPESRILMFMRSLVP